MTSVGTTATTRGMEKHNSWFLLDDEETKGPLEFDSARQELISRSAKLAYPIRDGIPIMLPEEARRID